MADIPGNSKENPQVYPEIQLSDKNSDTDDELETKRGSQESDNDSETKYENFPTEGTKQEKTMEMIWLEMKAMLVTQRTIQRASIKKSAIQEKGEQERKLESIDTRLALLDFRDSAATEALTVRVSKQERYMNEVQEKLANQSKETQDIKPKMALLDNNPQITQIIRNDSIKPPYFDYRRNQRPNKYIKDLKNYLKAANINNIAQIKGTINMGLNGMADDWWETVEERINSLEEFEENFKKRFWNDEAQKEAQRNWDWGKFDPQRNYSRVHYATKKYNLAKDLKMSTQEIIMGLSRHFDKDTNTTILCCKFETFDDLLVFLQRLDGQAKSKDEKQQETDDKKENQEDNNNKENYRNNGQKNNGYKNNGYRGNKNKEYRNNEKRVSKAATREQTQPNNLPTEEN